MPLRLIVHGWLFRLRECLHITGPAARAALLARITGAPAR
jgi:hypothetical protein